MVGKFKVVTICGSTCFKEEILAARKRLTLEGNIVLSPDLFGHSGDDEVWAPGMKEFLDDMHRRKIDMSDEVYVVNPGGYIGDSTRGGDRLRPPQRPRHPVPGGAGAMSGPSVKWRT